MLTVGVSEVGEGEGGRLTLAVQRHVDDFDVAVGREYLRDVGFCDILCQFLNDNLSVVQPISFQFLISTSS